MKGLALLYIFERIFHLQITQDSEYFYIFQGNKYNFFVDFSTKSYETIIYQPLFGEEKLGFSLLKDAFENKKISLEDFEKYFENKKIGYSFFDWIDYTGEFVVNFPDCNYRCGFCETHNVLKKRHRFSYEDIVETFLFITKLKSKINSVDLFGGEPTIDKNFLKLVDFFGLMKKRFGIEYVNVATNAFLLGNKNFACQVAGKIDCFRVSFHSLDKQYFENITRISGSFDKVCDAIKNLSDLKQLTIINTVLTKGNVEKIIPTISFLKKLSPNAFIKISGMVVSDLNFGNIKDIMLSINETKYFLYEKLLPFLQEKNITIQLEKLPYCLVSDFIKINKGEYLPEFYGNRYSDKICDICPKKSNCSRYHENHKKYLVEIGEWKDFNNIRKNFILNENTGFIHNQAL
ncbi:hypothetical protein BKN14_02925 [Candidatus Gracilibacteria bacterium HOT-871]|nr:hypothetical protein BKN14_02925 [Candidatus Gracilibacteria bacterium HOT-871]